MENKLISYMKIFKEVFSSSQLTAEIMWRKIYNWILTNFFVDEMVRTFPKQPNNSERKKLEFKVLSEQGELQDGHC